MCNTTEPLFSALRQLRNSLDVYRKARLNHALTACKTVRISWRVMQSQTVFALEYFSYFD